ncbi:MAG: cation diffusion facilitator family transporter [Candidatus Omnitrophota bacterium]
MKELKTHLHKHFYSRRKISRRRLKAAILLTGTVMVLEMIGGFISNSLALLSDAIHMLTHLFALGISFFAVTIAMRPATKEKTYGFFRAEVLAAFANGIVVLFIAGFIFYNALKRIANPQSVEAGGMLIIALIGLIANLITIFILSHPGKKDINLKGALLHVMGDTVSSVAVVGAGVFIYYTANFIVDPILSFLIAILIVIWSFRLLAEAGNILLESVPTHLDIDEIAEDIVYSIEEIQRVHDVHIWELTSHIYSMTVNVVVEDCSVSKTQEILKELTSLLRDKYDIFHLNVQFECGAE